MSDNVPLPSQANIYPTQPQQQTPRPSSPQLQPSIQISSSQLSPQQKPQPVVSSTFQGPEDLPITAKTISSIVNEDPRKSYLQKPAFETILEEDEDKKRDAGTDVARDTLSASIKDVQVRPDSEADKENSGSYEEIVDNIYLAERKRSKQMREVRRMVCDCTTSHEDREQGIEACGEDCLNRMLMIECGSRCPCGEYCNNKRFTRHQYVKVATFKTESKGLGLMTLDDLHRKHTFVMEYVGEVLDYKEFKNRTKQYAKNGQEHYYFMSLNADEVIDATYRGNKSRFINHSCDPNCETQKWTVNGMLRIGFFTKKSIKAGTEMTFDYQFESKQAQKCYCGAECCRGTIGGKKKTPVKSKKKAAASDKKKKEFEDESLEEEMERMSQLDGLKNKEHVLNLCRLMVRAESNDHRLSILRILQGTNEQACLRLFLDYHGLPLLWSWMADIGKGALYLKSQILGTLKMLPITNKTILQESKILPMVVRWANELKMTAEREVETEQSNDNSSQAGTPSSVASRDERPPKKKVKFADETSSDSEMSECSRLSGMIYLNEPMAKNGLNEVADSSDIPYPDYSNQGGIYIDELDETRAAKPVHVVSATPKSGILIKPELQKELSSESSSSPVVEDKVQSNEAESSSIDILDKCSTKEKAEDEVSPKDDDSSNEVKVAAEGKNFDSGNLSSVVSLATDLLKHWSDLKEVFKIPKKEKVEERKRTERELERDRKRRYEVSPDKSHSRFKSRSDRRREEVQELLNPNRPRRVLLPTPPKLSKEERRQQFEAQVRAQDEMAEYQKQQEAAYMQQQQEYLQQQYMGSEMTGYDYYVQQDPNMAYQQDPNMAYQQDPNMGYQQDPNAAVAYQADPNSAMYQQDPNAQYQDSSVYHGYHLPPPADPNAYPMPSTDASAYPMAQADVSTAYQMQSADSSAYQMHPSDPNAYAMRATDPNAYQVPPPDPATYQATTADQTGYIQADSSFQIPVPPPATSVPPDSSYPSTTPAATTGSSSAVAQKPQAGSENLLEHCYVAGQTAATVPDATTSQAAPNLNAIPTMTPTYIEPGSSTPAIYPNAPATPVYQVPSKFLTTPQTTAATAAYSQTNQSVPPQAQSASVPQLPPPASQVQSASGLASIPPSAQQNTSLTPVYVQQSQTSTQQPTTQQAAPTAPSQVYYPTTPQAMVVPPPQHHYPQPQATTPAVPGSQVVQIDQGLLALQQVKQLQQQLQIQNIVLSSTTQNTTANSMSEDDPPPPPSPPKPKVTKLPPNWKMAKDSEGKTYYYHTVTRQTQWDLPTWDQGDQDDMDLGTPTHDEPQNKVCDLFFQSKKKATTAAADTSSELAKRSKEAFRNKMSQWIVSCLNPYRKPDCRLGRISSTDDFKHLARKLTHHVMAKELKHCKHPEDLEVNENVKAKAKDYIKKYMSKFGANYKKAQSPTPDD
ncbi:SETD2 [Acanthosepion pharaonis]|uniref:[histone H3]-lysine(36) N-trimethyltransferase n=1 Tax=Acanthosepion pharaonis TaxID=158019 RepID=A0A812DW22_ACAPH|nr:SETD2 [Sepia pharaonis]